MIAMYEVLSLALFSALLVGSTATDHFSQCSNVGNEPEKAGNFVKFCQADATFPESQKAQYVCSFGTHPGAPGSSHQIADWGYIASATLELGK